MSSLLAQGRAIAQSQAQDQSRSIPYRPQYNAITGKVTATILLQQISYWWHKSGRKPFYKFRAPNEHQKYRQGDSWTEELGMTVYEFDGALRRIGKKVTKGQSKADLLNSHLVIYWTDSNRLTWYQLNESLFYTALCYAYNDPAVLKEVALSDLLGKREKPNYLGKREKPNYLYSKTTTENNTDNKGKSQNPPENSQNPQNPTPSVPERQGQVDLFDLAFKTARVQSRLNAPVQALEATALELFGLTKVPNYRCQRDWYEPLSDILDQADGDVDRADSAMRRAKARGAKDNLTLTCPRSIHGLTVQELASGNGAGANSAHDYKALPSAADDPDYTAWRQKGAQHG